MRRSLSRSPNRLYFKNDAIFIFFRKKFSSILLTLSDYHDIFISFMPWRASSMMTLRFFSWALAYL